MAFRKLSEFRYLALKADLKSVSSSITIGALCWETDADVECIYDGTAWVELQRIVTNIEHKRIHQGLMWNISELFEAVNNNAEANLVIEHTIELHAAFQIASEGAAFVSIFEAPTVTDATGSNAVVANARRATGDSGKPTALKDPTITNNGTLIAEWYNPGGSGGNANGWAAERESEIILTADTKYLFRMVNKKGNAADLSWVVHAYEFTEY